ncbi:hypothetical protein SDC9_161613 [bioreactor metagenome]|uniref:Uncharacterized protein n=1 Tax=bioreactor metagenome TaxID=1076179 RepID=A0A645FIU8_9ZZZZ
MELLEDAFLLHVAKHVHGEDPVGVLVCVGGVVAAVGSAVAVGSEVHNAGDVILAVLGSGG